MTASICKNCENNFEGNYCNYCGQSAHTHVLNWHYVSHEIQHGVFHVDKGLLFTIKELALRPGETIRRFIAGKRINYFKPTAMVIFLATIYGFLYHFFNISMSVSMGGIEANPDVTAQTKMAENWMASHYTLTVLLLIPIYAIGSYFAFRKARYNFVEHLVLNSFLAGQKLVVQILLFPLLYMGQKSENAGMVLTLSFITDVSLTIWMYMSFFNKFSVAGRIFRIILTYIILIIISLLVGVVYGAASVILKH